MASAINDVQVRNHFVGVMGNGDVLKDDSKTKFATEPCLTAEDESVTNEFETDFDWSVLQDTP